MPIRIGSSCALSLPMAIGKVVETRRFLDVPTQWYEIAKKCITSKVFLIVTLCIDKNNNLLHIPDNGKWRNFVEDSTVKLLSLGANWNNCRIDIINEPMNYIDKITYTSLVNIAHNQINGRLPVGAGCEEFILAQARGDMYPYLLRYGNFEVLVIHIQGSCLNEADCSKWTNLALNWAITNKKQLDCNEANYFSIDTDSGYRGLLMNLKYAEKIGCANFPMVFMNLDRSAFNVFDDVNDEKLDGWERLSFFVNGKLRSPYWNDFKNIIESKAPIPNIKIKRSVDGMIIRTIGFKNTDLKSGYPVLLVNELLYQNNFLSADKVGYSYTEDTKQGAIDFINHVRDSYPTDPVKQLLKSDGRIGRQTFRYLIEEIPDKSEREKYQFALEIMASPINIEGAGI